ncbi:MAG: hypothetical protein ABR968_14735 [Bacteroidales bacterium]
MAHLESDLVEIKNSSEKVYNFLSNMNNFGKLMPEQVINWQSTEDSCSFTIKGMTDLSMRISEKTPNSNITIIPGDNPPFPFSLICQLNEEQKDVTKAQILFNAELSMMMELLAKNPLQNFINLLVEKLKELGDKL